MIIGFEDLDGIVVVELDLEGWLLRESEGGAGFIPELSARRTVCQLADHLRGDAVEDDDARRLEHG